MRLRGVARRWDWETWRDIENLRLRLRDIEINWDWETLRDIEIETHWYREVLRDFVIERHWDCETYCKRRWLLETSSLRFWVRDIESDVLRHWARDIDIFWEIEIHRYGLRLRDLRDICIERHWGTLILRDIEKYWEIYKLT